MYVVYSSVTFDWPVRNYEVGCIHSLECSCVGYKTDNGYDHRAALHYLVQNRPTVFAVVFVTLHIRQYRKISSPPPKIFSYSALVRAKKVTTATK